MPTSVNTIRDDSTIGTNQGFEGRVNFGTEVPTKEKPPHLLPVEQYGEFERSLAALTVDTESENCKRTVQSVNNAIRPYSHLPALAHHPANTAENKDAGLEAVTTEIAMVIERARLLELGDDQVEAMLNGVSYYAMLYNRRAASEDGGKFEPNDVMHNGAKKNPAHLAGMLAAETALDLDSRFPVIGPYLKRSLGQESDSSVAPKLKPSWRDRLNIKRLSKRVIRSANNGAIGKVIASIYEGAEEKTEVEKTNITNKLRNLTVKTGVVFETKGGLHGICQEKFKLAELDEGLSFVSGIVPPFIDKQKLSETTLDLSHEVLNNDVYDALGLATLMELDTLITPEPEPTEVLNLIGTTHVIAQQHAASLRANAPLIHVTDVTPHPDSSNAIPDGFNRLQWSNVPRPKFGIRPENDDGTLTIDIREAGNEAVTTLDTLGSPETMVLLRIDLLRRLVRGYNLVEEPTYMKLLEAVNTLHEGSIIAPVLRTVKAMELTDSIDRSHTEYSNSGFAKSVKALNIIQSNFTSTN